MKKALPKAKILIAEDEVVIGYDLMERLERLGYNVCGVVISGEEAVELAGRECPDLVLMDIFLEGNINGVEAASLIRSKLDVAVVFVTAYDDKETLESAMQVDPVGYLLKPIEDRDLRIILEMAFSRITQERRRQVMAKALTESEQKYRTLVDAMLEGVVAIDARGSFSFVNNRFCRIMGHRAEELLGKSASELFNKENIKIWKEQIRRGEQGAIASFEMEIINRDGVRLDLHISAQPVFDSEGRFNGSIAVVSDVTEQKKTRMSLERAYDELEDRVRVRTAKLVETNQRLREEIKHRRLAEEKLRESEAHLRSLMESAKGFAIYRLLQDPNNPFDLKVVFVSPSVIDIMGTVNPDRFETWFENIHPDDRERMVEANRQALITNYFNETCRMYHPIKKEWRWIQAISTGLPQEMGLPVYANGILIDITTSKQNEEALRESEEIARAILDATTENVLLLDTDMRFREVNENAARRFKMTKKDFIGLHVMDVWPTELALKRIEYCRKVIETKSPIRWEDEWDNLHFDNSCHPIWDQKGNVVQLAVFGRDITRYKDTEKKLRQKEKALEQQTRNLEEANTALRVVVDQRDQEKIDMENNIRATVNKLIMPFVEKLDHSRLSSEQKTYVEILASNLSRITSPFARRVGLAEFGLTPVEIQVIEFIRNGENTKDIAKYMRVSPNTVSFHRRNIRTKLNITNRKMNLRAYLQNLFSDN